MSFQEVTSLDADVTIAVGKINKKTGKPYPKQIEGYYLGRRQVESKRGASNIHFLQTPSGNVGVWGTTDLDRKVGQVPAGAMIRITSTGTKSTPNGDMYTYKVEVDKTNSIEVGSAYEQEMESYQTEAKTASGAGEGYDDEYSADDENNDEDEVQTAALIAAERKAKVDALLAKGKNKKVS